MPVHVLTAIAILISALIAMPGNASAKQCKPNLQQFVAPPLFPEANARTTARLGWIHQVQLLYGQVWAHPGLAEGEKVTCIKQPTGTGAFLYTCIHRARPCKP